MSAPRYEDSDLSQQFLAMLPTGDAWPRDADSILVQTLAGFAPTMQRLTDSAADVLDQSLPNDAVNMLPEWEAALGLPDPCQGPAPTVPARQQQVLARFLATGGQSKEYFIQFAANLGYVITIDEFMPWLVGISAPGAYVGGANDAYIWRINVAAPGPIAVLECEINELKPAQTMVVFAYQ